MVTLELDGRAYLKTYYEGLHDHPESVATFSFMVKATKNLKPKARVLDLASGPTVYQVVSVARTASAILLTDYSPELLSLAERWKNDKADAFNWDPYIKNILAMEAAEGLPFSDSLSERKTKMRRAIEFAIIDINKPQLVSVSQPFDLVQSLYLGTSAATSEEDLLEIWKRCASYVVPGGDLLIIEVCEASYYAAGKSKVYAFKIGYEDQVNLIRRMGYPVISMEYVPAKEKGKYGYTGLAMFHLKKT